MAKLLWVTILSCIILGAITVTQVHGEILESLPFLGQFLNAEGSLGFLEILRSAIANFLTGARWMWLGVLTLLSLVYTAWLVVRKILSILFSPLNLHRALGDLGYTEIEGVKSQKDVANIVRRRRKIGDVPPVYPNGWFSLIASRDVPKGQARSVSVLGQHFAVFRGEDGKAYILDAYCPHMGANIGIGGRVIDNCLQCPFHGWTFRGEDGKCVNIPYAKKIPDIAKTKQWPCFEANGQIMVWHHAEGIDPTWMPEVMPEIDTGDWTFKGKTVHIINAHIEEIPENGADLAHLHHLHKPFIAAGVDLRYIYNPIYAMFSHKWVAQWEPLPAPDQHIGELNLVHSIEVWGYTIPFTTLSVTVHQVGPGLVNLKFKSVFGSGVFIQTLTPEEPMLQRLTHEIYYDWWMPAFLPKLMLRGEAMQVDRDVMIWNNKTYVSKPMLVKEDQLIAKHRRWYSQFFSENSPRLSFQKENNSEW